MSTFNELINQLDEKDSEASSSSNFDAAIDNLATHDPFEEDTITEIKPDRLSVGTEKVKTFLGDVAPGTEDLTDAAVNYLEGYVRATADRPLSAATATAFDVPSAKDVPFLKRVSGIMTAVPVTAAKELEELTGITSQRNSLLENFSDSIVEQLGAEVGGAVLRKLKLPGAKTERSIFDDEVAALSDDVAGPPAFGGVRAKDIEDELYSGQEVFLAEERTGGLLGGNEASKLERRALTAKEAFKGDPRKVRSLARNVKIQNKAKEIISKGQEVDKSTASQAFKSAYEYKISKLSGQATEALNQTVPLAEEAARQGLRTINGRTITENITANTGEIDRAFGLGTTRQLTNQLNKLREVRGVDGLFDAELGDTITPEGLRRFEAQLWDKVGDDPQRQAVYLKSVWPTISAALEETAKRNDVSGDFAKNMLVSNNNRIALSEMRNSRAFKLFDGITDKNIDTKIDTLLQDKGLRNELFNSLKGSGDGALLSLEGLMEARIKETAVDQLSGNMTAKGAANIYKKYGRDNLLDVLGPDRVRQLDLISTQSFLVEQKRLLSELQSIRASGGDISEAVVELGQNIAASRSAAGGVLPRHNVGGAQAWVSVKLAKALGITDQKALQNAMMSNVSKSFMETRLTHPRAYAAYKELVRGLGVLPITREEYFKRVEEYEEQTKIKDVSDEDLEILMDAMFPTAGQPSSTEEVK